MGLRTQFLSVRPFSCPPCSGGQQKDVAGPYISETKKYNSLNIKYIFLYVNPKAIHSKFYFLILAFNINIYIVKSRY